MDRPVKSSVHPTKAELYTARAKVIYYKKVLAGLKLYDKASHTPENEQFIREYNEGRLSYWQNRLTLLLKIEGTGHTQHNTITSPANTSPSL